MVCNIRQRNKITHFKIDSECYVGYQYYGESASLYKSQPQITKAWKLGYLRSQLQMDITMLMVIFNLHIIILQLISSQIPMAWKLGSAISLTDVHCHAHGHIQFTHNHDNPSANFTELHRSQMACWKLGYLQCPLPCSWPYNIHLTHNHDNPSVNFPKVKIVCDNRIIM